MRDLGCQGRMVGQTLGQARVSHVLQAQFYGWDIPMTATEILMGRVCKKPWKGRHHRLLVRTMKIKSGMIKAWFGIE